MSRQHSASGTPWEDLVGYSRAIRVGNLIEVSGTTAIRDGQIVGVGDVEAQTTFILEKIKTVLEGFGAGLEHVIRTRIYVTNIQQWESIGRVHGTFFQQIRPAATMVEVRALIHPDMLVEIEVTAML